jgi:transcription antitermination factor NusA-like protein
VLQLPKPSLLKLGILNGMVEMHRVEEEPGRREQIQFHCSSHAIEQVCGTILL